jgi:phage terminase large subunit
VKPTQVKLPDKLYPLIAPARYKGAAGGRASGKSHFFATILVLKHYQCPDLNSVCIREVLKSLKFSAKKLINDKINELGLSSYFEVRQNEIIRIGGNGIIIFQGMSDHNADSIKSLEGFDVAWVEEAQSLSQRSMDLLLPTIRKKGSEVWCSWNPNSKTDPVDKLFANDPDAVKVHINYYDNPFCPDTIKREAEKLKQRDPKAYAHIFLGDYSEEVGNALIKNAWFEAALDSHLKLGFIPQGIKVATHDPADVGNDEKVVAIRHGVVFTHIQGLEAANANIASDMACDIAIEQQVDSYGWDCDGMGALLREQVANKFAGKKVITWMFKGSEGVHDPDLIFDPNADYYMHGAKKNSEVFKNKRSQSYTNLARRCYDTYRAVELKEYVDPDRLVSFSSQIPEKEIEALRSELCRLPVKPSSVGRIELYSKEEMRKGILMPDGTKLKLPSPGRADCLMMSFDKASSAVIAPPVRKPRPIRPINPRGMR